MPFFLLGAGNPAANGLARRGWRRSRRPSRSARVSAAGCTASIGFSPWRRTPVAVTLGGGILRRSAPLRSAPAYCNLPESGRGESRFEGHRLVEPSPPAGRRVRAHELQEGAPELHDRTIHRAVGGDGHPLGVRAVDERVERPGAKVADADAVLPSRMLAVARRSGVGDVDGVVGADVEAAGAAVLVELLQKGAVGRRRRGGAGEARRPRGRGAARAVLGRGRSPGPVGLHRRPRSEVRPLPADRLPGVPAGGAGTLRRLLPGRAAPAGRGAGAEDRGALRGAGGGTPDLRPRRLPGREHVLPGRRRRRGRLRRPYRGRGRGRLRGGRLAGLRAGRRPLRRGVLPGGQRRHRRPPPHRTRGARGVPRHSVPPWGSGTSRSTTAGAPIVRTRSASSCPSCWGAADSISKTAGSATS